MFSESEWMYERHRLYGLVQEHPEWSLRAYARETGHDAGWVRKWLGRFKAWTSPTFEMFRSHSRRPKRSPTQLGMPLKDRICELRESLSERFWRRAGAKTIQYYLKPTQPALPCARSIYKVLHERDYVRAPGPVRREPLRLPSLMEEWEMDFGEIYLGETEGSLEFFLVVDRGSSRVVYVEGSNGYRAESAIDAVMRLFAAHGLPKRLRFDRDPRFWGSWTRDSYPSPLLKCLQVLGIEPIVCPPHRPDLKPFVERTIRTLKEEWLARHSPTTLAEALGVLAPFMLYHNQQRPHQGRACQNRIPDEVFPVLPILPSLPTVVHPNRWLEVQHRRIFRRRVNAAGAIQVDRFSYYVGKLYAGTVVLVHLDGQKARLLVTQSGNLLTVLPLKGIHAESLPLVEYLDLMKAEARSIEYFHHLHWEQTGDKL